MNLLKRIALVLLLLNFHAYTNSCAQLWKYIGDTPAKEDSFEKVIEKEACLVIKKPVKVYSDTFSYKIITYAIQSLDNKPDSISLIDIPFTPGLKIKSKTDTFRITDFDALDKVHHLSKDLLEIVYGSRGGSDQGFENVIILAVNRGKFCIVMQALTVNEWDGPDEYGLYDTDLRLLGQNTHNYKLEVNTRDFYKSTAKPAKNFDRHKIFILKYDEKQHIFYNAIIHINGKYKITDTNNRSKHRQLSGDYSVLKLVNDEYYHLDGKWYGKGKDSFFVAFD